MSYDCTFFENVLVSEDYNFVRKSDPFITEPDAKLEGLAYGVLGSVVRRMVRTIKKGIDYLIKKILKEKS